MYSDDYENDDDDDVNDDFDDDADDDDNDDDLRAKRIKTHNIGIQIKRKELTKKFMMISN